MLKRKLVLALKWRDDRLNTIHTSTVGSYDLPEQESYEDDSRLLDEIQDAVLNAIKTFTPDTRTEEQKRSDGNTALLDIIFGVATGIKIVKEIKLIKGVVLIKVSGLTDVQATVLNNEYQVISNDDGTYEICTYKESLSELKELLNTIA